MEGEQLFPAICANGGGNLLIVPARLKCRLIYTEMEKLRRGTTRSAAAGA
jgi:hypothetical protein